MASPSGTLDPSIGHETAVAIAKESNWAEDVTSSGSFDFLPQAGSDISGELERLEDPTITGVAATQPSLAGTLTVNGPIDLTVDPEKFGYPLYYTLGAYVAASGSGSEFQHSFYGTDLDSVTNKLPSFSLIRKLGSFNTRQAGGRVGSLAMDQPLGDVLTATMNATWHDEIEPSGTNVPPTPTISTEPLTFRDGTIEADLDLSDGLSLSQLAEIQAIDFTIENNIGSDPSINSGRNVAYVRRLGRNITGSMTVKYEDNSFFNAYINDRDIEMKLTWDASETTSGTNNSKQLIFRFPLVKFQTAPIAPGGGEEVVEQTIDFEAKYKNDATETLVDGSTLTGFDVYAELRNNTDSGVYDS